MLCKATQTPGVQAQNAFQCWFSMSQGCRLRPSQIRPPLPRTLSRAKAMKHELDRTPQGRPVY